MKKKSKRILKDFYTTKELVEEPWFPVRSTLTILKLIKGGKLQAVNIGAGEKLKRFRISKESALTFSEENSNFKTKNKNIKKKAKLK